MKTRNIIAVMLVSIFLIGLTYAGLSSSFDKQITLDKARSDALKENRFTDIKVSGMTCDSSICKVHLSKSNVIDTDILISNNWKEYATNITTGEFLLDENKSYIVKSINYFDDATLKQRMQEAIDNRIKEIADYYITDKAKTTPTEKFADGGVITIK